MFCVTVLNNCQNVTVEERIEREPGSSPSESRIRDRTQGTLSSGGIHHSAEGLYQYLIGGGSAKRPNLIPSCLRREFVVAFGAFKAVFRIVVLSNCQHVTVEERIEREPGPSPSESRIRDRTQGTLSSGGIHHSAEGLYQYHRRGIGETNEPHP